MSTLRRVIIATKKAPDAIGPYNQVQWLHTFSEKKLTAKLNFIIELKWYCSSGLNLTICEPNILYLPNTK